MLMRGIQKQFDKYNKFIYIDQLSRRKIDDIIIKKKKKAILSIFSFTSFKSQRHII